MGRPRKYECKICSDTFSGPGDLGRHYRDNPDHRPGYLAKRQGGSPKSKANGISKEPRIDPRIEATIGAAAGAFEQLAGLKQKFEGEIAREVANIDYMKAKLAEHESELKRLRNAVAVLGNAMGNESVPEEHAVFGNPIQQAS